MNSPTLSSCDIVRGVLAYIYSSRNTIKAWPSLQNRSVGPGPSTSENHRLIIHMSFTWSLTPRGSWIPADVFHTSGECSLLFVPLARLYCTDILRNVPRTPLNFKLEPFKRSYSQLTFFNFLYNIRGCAWVLVRQSTITRQRLQHQACGVVLQWIYQIKGKLHS